MKKKLLITMLFMMMPLSVMASPNASISVSSNVIEKGKSVTATITLTDTAAWNVKIAGSGAGTCSTKQADVTSDGKSTTKKFTLSCTSTSEGTLTFKVTGDITSGSGETKDISLNKDITVNKPKSSVNTLSDLKVDGVTVAGFSGSKTSYTLDKSSTSINISASATDDKASVSGVGSKTLKYGKNSFNVVVTAENGSKKTYTIVVNKPDPRSSNNNLKLLSINHGTIDFNKTTTNYTVKLEHEINEIKISASAEDSKASVSGTGVKTLKDYINEFKVVVKAENESTKTYTLKVVRKDSAGNYGKLSTDNSLKSLSITNHDFKFDSNTKKYNILVDKDVNELDINVVPNDSTATIQIQNNENLKPGLNKVIVQVVAENGNINEYLFNVYKIGEEKIEEPVKEEPVVEPKKEETNFNIWMIVSIVEFVLLIFLIFLLIFKKKKKETSVSTNSDKTNDVDYETFSNSIEPKKKMNNDSVYNQSNNYNNQYSNSLNNDYKTNDSYENINKNGMMGSYSNQENNNNGN